ncbi:hypothetical protein CMI42_03950 [Candidatus Pacearchaeota archaeon]|nr:hypothetical protein [Candidatus Pacearchaeota archaeon]
MGLFDFLKGIIPEKFIYINVDNRKIEVKDSSVVIGDQVINDPEMVGKIFDKIEEYKNKESLPCQLIHKDLLDSFIEYEELSITQKESLKKLKEILLEEDVQCILMARRVKKAYDKGDSNLAKKLHSQLDRNFPKKGNKVFNLISGGYFDEMILPFIDVFKSEYEEKHIEKYRDFYSNILKFFPLAFFVSNNTTNERLKEGLIERLRLKGVPFVRLHAIGKSNMEKIEEVIGELKIEEQYLIKDNRFTSPTGLRAQIFEIKFRKEKGSREESV